jgi:hypothetical protein
MTTKINTYPVVLFSEDGSHKVLGVYDTYDAADHAVDSYSEIYPNGYVDVLTN